VARNLNLSSWLLSAALAALMVQAPAYAQDASPTDSDGTGSVIASPVEEGGPETVFGSGETLQTEAPPGFENLAEPLDTFFDTLYLGRRLGSFRARFRDGYLTYTNPELIVEALSGMIDEEAARDLLSAPLQANEQYRCFSGQTTNCGVLPAGQAGAIVNGDRFSAELFFRPEDIIITETDYLTLGEATTGPSLIQGAQFSIAHSGNADGVRYGATFNTAASMGRTAILAQTILDSDRGAQLREITGQHVWDQRIARAGLFEDFDTRLLTSYRMVGAELASFYPSKAYESSIATPIQIVLPRGADVELRRQGTLLATRYYPAGLQVIDTSRLPTGSYELEITARAEGAVIYEEQRAFTRAPGLPIKGKTEFNFRAGLLAENNFEFSTDADNQPFFPNVGSAPVFSAGLSRRLGGASAGNVNLLYIDEEFFGEISATAVSRNLQGFLSAAVGDDGSYGALISGTLDVEPVSFSLTARTTESKRDNLGFITDSDTPEYRPFVRSENSIFGTVSFPVMDGSLSVSGGYRDLENIEDEYSADLRYIKPVEIAGNNTLFTLFGRYSTRDTRVGFTLSYLFGLNSQTTASVRAGAEYVDRSTNADREGLWPLLDANISRRFDVGSSDVLGQAGVSTSSDNDRAYLSAETRTSYGIFDTTAQYQKSRGGGDFSSIFANGRTGFAIGGGKMKLGLAEPGQAVIMSDINIDESKYEINSDAADSGYRIRVNSQPFDKIRPGKISAVGVQPYQDYEIDLEPEGAPPFEVDTAIQKVTLYPGNVAYFQYDATQSLALFGQLVNEFGAPISNARVQAENDITSTDARGYFLITVTPESSLTMRNTEGLTCAPIEVDTLISGKVSGEFFRAGEVVCEVDPEEAAEYENNKTINVTRNAPPRPVVTQAQTSPAPVTSLKKGASETRSSYPSTIPANEP